MHVRFQSRFLSTVIFSQIDNHQITKCFIYAGDDTFTIQHNENGKCLLVQNEALKLGNCSLVPVASWKWGSAHRLFHVESSKCLGLEVRSKTVTLSSCDSTEILRWKCYEDVIYTEYQMKLSAGPDDSVTAKRDGQDTWKEEGAWITSVSWRIEV